MKFCFFGDISGALKGKTKGGGELQVALLAKALAAKGHNIVIIDPYSNESFTTADGVEVINVPGWNKGWKGIRMFIYRIPALWRIFIRQNADFYYTRMRSYVHLLPYLAAKKNGGKFVLAIASDLDMFSAREKFQYEYKSDFKFLRYFSEHFPNDMVFKYLLKKSDYVVLQHSGQKFASKDSGSKQVIFPNIIDLSNLPVNINCREDYYIYAGSLTMLKGADNLVKLINIINDSVSILIVGLPRGERATELYEELRKKKNVILKGQKSQRETVELISKAKALINTSYYEGFPNIYLEAWATGVPVISLTVNPGNIFNRYGLGVCCNSDLNRMKLCIETNEVVQFNKDSLKAYVEEFHNFKTAAARFLNVLGVKLLSNFS